MKLLLGKETLNGFIRSKHSKFLSKGFIEFLRLENLSPNKVKAFSEGDIFIPFDEDPNINGKLERLILRDNYNFLVGNDGYTLHSHDGLLKVVFLKSYTKHPNFKTAALNIMNALLSIMDIEGSIKSIEPMDDHLYLTFDNLSLMSKAQLNEYLRFLGVRYQFTFDPLEDTESTNPYTLSIYYQDKT